MKNCLKNNWQLILLETLVIIIFCLFYGKYGDINIDSFREAYISQEMIQGKALYKDIFCIYSPLSYLINSVLFFIFGIKLKTLYIAGLAALCGIIYIIGKISEQFLNKFETFSISLLFISAFALSPNVFNPFFPYSYGLLYGILFILCSIWFVIKEKYPFAYFFYALAICSKYEFLLLIPLLIFITGKKDLLKNITAFISPILITFVILLISGAGIKYILLNAGLTAVMAQTSTLHWFYSSMGLIFRWEHLPIYFENFIKFFIPYKFIYQEFLIWIFPVITVIFAFRFKHLNRKERFFIAASLIISLKVFFALTLQSYGVFFLPFALISIFILIPEKYRKILTTYFIIWAVIIGFNNIQSLQNKNYKIETSKGIIYTNQLYGKSFDKTIQYLKTLPEDIKAAVYPEGLGINFLSDRKSDSKFYSLIPLYVETFGENNIIKRFEITQPDYIVITDYNTSAYYYEKFGYDYAHGVYEHIKQNYSLEKTFGEDFKINIWKRN